MTVPASQVLCAAKTSDRPSRFALVVPRLRGTTVVRASFSGRPDDAGSEPGACSPGAPAGMSSDGDGQISQVPGEPLCAFALHTYPGQTFMTRLFVMLARSPPMPRTRALTTVTFEAQSHGVRTRCLRFAARVAPGPRKTRYRLVASLYRTGLATRWAPM